MIQPQPEHGSFLRY